MLSSTLESFEFARCYSMNSACGYEDIVRMYISILNLAFYEEHL